MAKQGGGGARGNKGAMDNRSRQMNANDSVGQSSRAASSPAPAPSPQVPAPQGGDKPKPGDG